MALTPIDVQQKTFRQAFKGYDGGEVDEFLDDVVIALREYEQKLRESEDRVAVLEDQLRSRVDSDDSIKRAFLSAQRAADSLIDEAKLESDGLVQAAKAESDGILARAREEASALTEEQASEKAKLLANLDALRATTSDLTERLRAVAAGQLEAVAALASDAEEAGERFDEAEHPATDPEGELTEGEPSEGTGSRYQSYDDEADHSPVDESAASALTGGRIVMDDDTPTETMTAWNRPGSSESHWDNDDTATQEVPTLRRPWERGADQSG